MRVPALPSGAALRALHLLALASTLLVAIGCTPDAADPRDADATGRAPAVGEARAQPQGDGASSQQIQPDAIAATARMPEGGADDPAAYYAGLVQRHDGGYEACGESQRTLPQECAEARDIPGLAGNGSGNVLLMLDASGSMAKRIDGETMLVIAQDALVDFSRRLPEQARVGFRVYGHTGNNRETGKAESCAGTELLYPLGTLDEKRFEAALRSFQPVGWTPIAASLEAAAGDFSEAAEAGSTNIIYMVSDGIETCDGDPVAAARNLQQSDVQVVVNIIGFDVDHEEARQLRAIAEAGGGEYLAAGNRNDLYRIFNARSREAHTRYNCASRELHGAYNATSRDQHGRYNCLSRRAHGEYNNVSRDAHRAYNEKRISLEQRDHALSEAVRKRDNILDPARSERDRVLDESRRERDQRLDSERQQRNDRLEAAQRERDQ